MRPTKSADFLAGTIQSGYRIPPHPAPNQHGAGLFPERARQDHHPVRPRLTGGEAGCAPTRTGEGDFIPPTASFRLRGWFKSPSGGRRAAQWATIATKSSCRAGKPNGLPAESSDFQTTFLEVFQLLQPIGFQLR